MFRLKFKLRANKSFDLSSFLVGNENRVFEHGGKGGVVKKSARRTAFNYLEKISAVYLRTTDFVNKFLEFTGVRNSRLVLFVNLKGLNHITYSNIQYIDILTSWWVSENILVGLEFLFSNPSSFRGKYRCIKKFKRKLRIGKRVMTDKSLWRVDNGQDL